MKNKLKIFIKSGNGTSTVEFALTIGIFLAVVFSIFELGRMSILSAYMDLTISEAVKVTKNTKVANYNYEEEFKKNLDIIIDKIKDNNKTFKFLDMNDQDILSFKVKYAESVSDLVAGKYRNTMDPNDPKKTIADPGKNAALAKYSFQYNYKPMFFWMPSVISNPVFNREVIILQEYERNKFKIR